MEEVDEVNQEVTIAAPVQPHKKRGLQPVPVLRALPVPAVPMSEMLLPPPSKKVKPTVSALRRASGACSAGGITSSIALGVEESGLAEDDVFQTVW